MINQNIKCVYDHQTNIGCYLSSQYVCPSIYWWLKGIHLETGVEKLKYYYNQSINDQKFAWYLWFIGG